MNSIMRYLAGGCMLCIPLAYASDHDEQVPNQTQQEQVPIAIPQVGDKCEFPIAKHTVHVNSKTSLTQQLLEQHIERQKATIAACERNTQQLTQEKNEALQQNLTFKQENTQLAHERTTLQQQVASHEQAKKQLMQEKEATLQENSTLKQENTKKTHKIEDLIQKNNKVEHESQLHKSYWKTADQLLKDISQHTAMLVMHNNALSVTAYRYKIAAYVMATTSACLALYSCWNGVQRTLNALGARIMALITSDKTRKQRSKKIEEELLTKEE